ncbi:arylsulfatase B-like [Paramacrobiotus metropolitanus]|uniref:arylsulfatase B-like n=1 Tax=Paramacrobiotus metropolitanus TaxID=2943436 RepID=UPI00244575C1|nr:arylsulfatase B-like [Paramacrobiotus metropolitanus]
MVNLRLLRIPLSTILLVLVLRSNGQFFDKSINSIHNARIPIAQNFGAKRPNILIFMADDLGHADLSYTEGSIQTPTPNIDKLAWDGIILNRHYSNSLGSPSRSSFFTAKHAITTGMQSASIESGEPWGLPFNLKIQPQYFKEMGYSTHAIGKWNLGSSQRAFYPNNRGFDTWYGFSASSMNWFNYTEGWVSPYPTSGRLLRDQGIAVPSNVTNNAYAPDLFTIRAEQIIRDSDVNVPFYMFFSTPIPHTAFAEYRAIQQTMPQFDLRSPVAKFSDQFPERKKQLGVIQALDESFKRLYDALVNKDVLNNTIIVFLTDNGAPVPPAATFLRGSNHGSNWPLRHGKGTLFEGGVRTPAFIWTPMIPKRGRISNQLVHITDWLPTLYEAAGGNLGDLNSMDGVSQWQTLLRGLEDGPRTEVLLNINPMNGQAGLVYRDVDGSLYKYVAGSVFDNTFTGWSRTEGTTMDNPMTMFSAAAIKCNFQPGTEVSPCRSWEKACLFDLLNDPCETNNIADSNPSMLNLLSQKIQAYNSTSAVPLVRAFDLRSDPANWDGVWAPWLDDGQILDSLQAFKSLN